MSRLAIVAAVICLITVVASLSIDIAPYSQECFFEQLAEGDKMTISYQVADGDSRGIDFTLYGPRNNELKSAYGETSAIHVFVAPSDGKYEYCFSNKASSVPVKSVNFNVHDMLKVERNAAGESRTVCHPQHTNWEIEHIDPIENEIRELADSIFAIKAEQEYIVVRERQHRNTAESTNSRVKWWSIGQLILLAVVCFWQVFYLKRFFEVKRAV
ncbi:p24 complex component [Apophysomyces ossiformis]|uniref:p24 complex component n=1 Tax=Apophysomyces ossiformis TaxID=679940 RepID=A0A8H7ESC7_9FUNG|nr:p24 complex component [Apophysomyces ossiformis]